MTTTQSVQEQPANSASYERMLHKGMAAACFLFGLLLLLAAVYRLTGEETIHDSGWYSSNDIYINNFLWLAWLAGIVAMVGLAHLVKGKKPMLTFWGTACVFIGSVMQMAAYKGAARTTDLRLLGFDIYWNISSGLTPAFFEAFGFTVLLWVIGLIILAIAVWQTAVLPRWVSMLAIVGTIAYAMSENVAGTTGGIITLIAAVSFTVVFSLVGVRLWRRGTAVA